MGSVLPCIPVYVALPALAGAVLLALTAQNKIQRTRRRKAGADQTGILKFLSLHDRRGILSQSADSRQAVEQGLDAVLASLSLDRGYVSVRSTDMEGLTHSAARGFSPKAAASLSDGTLRDYLLSSPERWGQMMVFPDLSRHDVFASWQLDPAFKEFQGFFLAQGIKALVVVGLYGIEEKLCGVMLLGQSQPRSFAAGELRLLESVGERIALCLESRTIEGPAPRRSEELEVLHQVAEALSATFELDKQMEILKPVLRNILGLKNFWIVFQDSGNPRIESLAAVEDAAADWLKAETAGGGLTRHVLQNRTPLMIPRDFAAQAARLGITDPGRHIRFWCGTPIRLSDGSLAALAAADCDREGVLDEHQFQLLQVLATEAGVAIENARLYQREQRRARHLALLNEVGRKVAGMLNPQELKTSICRQIRETFGYDLVRFETCDAAQEELVVEAQEGYGNELIGRRSRIGESLAGVAAETGEPAVANRASRDSRYAPLHPDARSALSLPLKYGAEVLGVLSIGSLHENGFSDQDVLTLRTLADQLAVALHNASSFQVAQQEAITDNLTQLKTHRFFMETLSAEWRRAPRSGHPFSIIMLDLDGFKRVNDRYGHLEGDRVLISVGRLLASRTRHVNAVARFGGDEFAVLMPEANTDKAEILAQRLCTALASDPYLASHGVTASIGIATFPAHGATTDELLRVADCGMFLAKHEKGNCVRVASRAGNSGKGELEQELLEAYLGVAVKRLFSTGPDAFEQYMKRFEQTVPGHSASSASLMDTVTALAFAIDAKDHYTQGHSQSVSRLAVQLARQMGLPESEIEEIRLAGILHDIGKIGIPEQLLNKPAGLSEDEYEIVKSHAILGEKILGPLKGKGMGRIRRMVRHHHECMNGRGYPDGLEGKDIPLGARVLTIADSYDTMTSQRSYKQGRTPEDALAELHRCAGSHFDPALVEAFTKLLAAGGSAAGRNFAQQIEGQPN
jgi:diguanylate cyclase (GGDEF)-like protein